MDYNRLVPYLIAAVVVFAVYRRLRRQFGPQPLKPVRMRIRIAILAVLGCLLLPASMKGVDFFLAEILGAAVGLSLGYWGAINTRYEYIQGGLHYVPHTYTGIAVSLLFLGRLSFRLVHLRMNGFNESDDSFPPPSIVNSSATVAIFFILIGYYLFYYGWVLWKSKHIGTNDLETAETSTHGK